MPTGGLAPDNSGQDEAPLPNNRRGARQLALQALYWEASTPGDLEAALEMLAPRSRLSPELRNFAARLARAAVEHRQQLDGLVGKAAAHWEHSRLARVDAIILRLALAEILHFEDIPVRVSIDEAVELSRLYSTSQSYAFVNGVLDAIVRDQGLPL
ncbi:MAG: transcription antitermination factor NusB [Candidatus Latescibacterota bacterium]